MISLRTLTLGIAQGYPTLDFSTTQWYNRVHDYKREQRESYFKARAF